MTRISKQGRRRAVSKRRPQAPVPKTGPLKDNLPKGFKEHINAAEGELTGKVFIPKIQRSR